MLLDLPINPGDMATTQRLQHSRKIYFHDIRWYSVIFASPQNMAWLDFIQKVETTNCCPPQWTWL
jgi:hypothetical protein